MKLCMWIAAALQQMSDRPLTVSADSPRPHLVLVADNVG